MAAYLEVTSNKLMLIRDGLHIKNAF
jgi:hypothetical protein